MKEMPDETYEQTVTALTEGNELMKKATAALLKNDELMKKAAARIRELDKSNKFIAESLKELLSKIPDSLESLSDKLYEDKYFYEVVKNETFKTITLIGPLDGIRYAQQVYGEKFTKQENYKFVQLVSGRPAAAFLESEILVTDHIL